MTPWSWIKLAIAATAFAGWTWTVAHWSTQLNEAKWLRSQNAQQKENEAQARRLDKYSYDAGKRYESARKQTQDTLTTPDRKLDETLQSAAGDVVIPGDLGVRLNSIGRAASPPQLAASEPSGGLRPDSSVPHGFGPATDVAPAAGDEPGATYRLHRPAPRTGRLGEEAPSS